MKGKFTKIMAALALLVFMTPSLAGWGQTKITDISNIVSGTRYYIGATTSNTDYYLYVDGTSLSESIAGTAKTSMSEATPFTFEGADAIWTIKFDNGYYLSLKNSKDNGKVQVVETAANFVASNQSSKIRLNIQVENEAGGYAIEKNNSGTQFGSYANTQTDIWLMEIPSASTTFTVTYKANGGTGEDYLVEDIENGASHTVLGIDAVGFTAPENKTFVNWKDDNDNEYAVGSEITVNGNINLYAQWQLSGSYLFYESFDTNNGTGGNDNQWSGSIASSTLQSDNEDWTFANGSGADRCAKFGTGSKLGSAQTPAINHTGNATLTFKAAAWNGGSESTTLKLSATSGNLSASTVTLEKGAWTDYTITITGITTSTQIKFEGNAASNSRFFLDEVMVVEAAPSTDPYITAEDVEIAYDATSGSILAEIGNYVAGSVVASTEAAWITDFTYEQAEEVFEIGFTASQNESASAREAEVVLTFTYGDNQTTTATVTVTQAGNSNLPGGADNPYTVAQARAAIDAGEGVNDVYATGIVSEIVTAYSSQYGNISYNISADGSTEADQLQAYRGKSYNGENFTSEDDIQVGDIVVVYGDLKNYNGTYEFDAGNQLVSLERPQSTEPSINIDNATIEIAAEGGEGILTVQYENITDIVAEVYFCDAEGEAVTYDWIEAVIDDDNNVYYMIGANEGEARTAYFKVYALDDEANVVYSDLVTVNQAAYVVPITSGTGTIIFGSAEGSTKINSTSVTGVDDLGNTWTITTVFSGEESFTQNASYSQVGASSKPATSISFTMTLPNEAVISSFEAKFGGFNGTAGNVTLSVGSETVGTGALNASNDVTISSLPMITGTILTVTVTDIAKGVKCYYISYTLGAESYTLNITGYASDDTKDGYYLIASPVSVNPATVAGMTEGDFDLYSYDDTEELEWRNYEASAFNLEPGKGYLYAKKATTENPSYEFTLTGAPYAGQPIQLIQGWNLVGNPYGQIAYITNEYYMMNPEGNDLVPGEGNAIDVMQGIFVNATEAVTMTFSTENNAKAVQQVVMNVTRNRGAAIDRAIVRFDEGQQLPKFQLFESSTKLYIPQGNSDYAIVRSAAEGEMPLNFKAKENGTYTISVNTENVEMDYLHLIDNMTGTDVDLLATPSYTFEATTRDYTSRFRLVFSANETDGPSTGSGAFAYFNGSEWQISNIGEATLQVVDVMGRVVKNVALEGNATVSINEMPGVYMMRLLNGNDVKVQKVVIR